MAQAYGAKGKRVEKPRDIQTPMRRAIDSNKPYVLDIRIGGPHSRILNVTTRSSWGEFGRR